MEIVSTIMDGKRLEKIKTKIVATLGPATSSPEAIEGLIRAGVGVVRLNLSHGDRAFHERAVSVIREVSTRLNVPVAVLLGLVR